MLRLVLVTMLSIGLFSCTSTTVKNHIADGNWFAVGEFESTQGYSKKSEAKLQDINVKLSTNKVNYSEYLKGYQHGLIEYCTPSKAYIRGAQGFPYRYLCKDFPNAAMIYSEWKSGRASKAP